MTGHGTDGGDPDAERTGETEPAGSEQPLDDEPEHAGGEESSEVETGPAKGAEAPGDEPEHADEHGSGPGYSRLAVWANAAVSLVVTAAIIYWASAFALDFEMLFRVSPTIEGGGIGANFVAGNQIAWLNWLITLVHLADVVLGLFILLMVFVHWGAFRRLAARMRQPGEAAVTEEAATDGGAAPEDDAAAEEGRSAGRGGDRG